MVIVTPGIAQSTFNHPGNILMTDQFNNRVTEIDRAGNIVWQYPLVGASPDNVSSSAIIGTNDSERVGGLTLMAGTGIPHKPARNAFSQGALTTASCS